MPYLTWLIFAILGVVISLVARRNTKSLVTRSNVKIINDATQPGERKLDKNLYDELKRIAYSVQYKQLQLADPGDKEILYGVLMDWDFEGQAIITLVSFKSGEASLYFSSGAVIIGGGQYAEVREASKRFVEKSESLLPGASRADTALTTEKGILKFYLLTNKGKYAVQDKMTNVNTNNSRLNDMFNEGNKLISYIRMAEERIRQKGNNN